MTSLVISIFSRVALALPAGAGVPYIVGGEETVAFPAVVSLEALLPDGGHAGFCTGTLVGDRWVLTAAHCVAAASDARYTYWVAFGADLSAGQPEDFVPWAATYRLQRADPDRVTRGFDLGLIELAEPVDVPPLPMQADSLRADLVGTEVVLVGYGTTVGVDEGVPPVRRVARVDVDALLPQLILMSDDTSSACYGDSGGPVLNAAGNAVIGVTSFGVVDCDPRFAAGTRVDANFAWIEGVMGEEPLEEIETFAADDAAQCACGASGRSGVGGVLVLSLALVLRRRRTPVR